MDWGTQRVLVTGGAGFIGSHVVHALLGLGAEVVVLDDMSIGERTALPNHSRLRVIEDTVTDAVVVASAMQGATAVVHLAALASVPLSVQAPERCFRSNVVGAETVLDAAYRQGVKGRILLASSAAVYGVQPVAQPYAEALADGAVPPTPYAASKRMNEQQAHMYRTCFGMAVHALRFFNVYGPGQAMSPTAGVLTRVAHNLTQGAPIDLYGDGLQLRDYVYIGDVVRAIVALLASPADVALPPVMNVASGVATPLREAMTLVAKTLGVAPNWRIQPASAGDVRYSCAAVDVLRQTLPQWQPTPLAEGLQAWLGVEQRKSA